MQRLITGLAVAIAVSALTLLAPSWAVLIALLAVSLLAVVELVAMARVQAPGLSRVPLLLAVPAAVALIHFAEMRSIGAFAVTVGSGWATVMFALFCGFALRGSSTERMAAALWMGWGLVYLTVPLLAYVSVHVRDPWLAFLLLAIVGFDDTLAYFVGSKIGKRRLAPKLSPKKSWEGSIAGLVGALIVAAIWCLWHLGVLDWRLLTLCAVTVVVAQMGDLLESLMKRSVGVKDSGVLLPGHGGILDRVDAMLLAAPVFDIGCRLLYDGLLD